MEDEDGAGNGAEMVAGRRVAIIGCGAMGSEICAQLIRKGIRRASEIIATRRSYGELVKLSADYGVGVTTDNRKAVQGARIVVLAVRPQQMRKVLGGISPFVPKDAIVVSVAVGLDLGFYEKYFPDSPVFRVMPNPFIASGLGIMPYSKNGRCDAAAVEELRRLFEPLCEEFVEIHDGQMHAFTAFASSSSALFYYVFDSLLKNAAGMERKTAKKVLLSSAGAAARHAMSCEEELAGLVGRACTPNGMTAKGIEYLRANGVHEHLQTALRKITERSVEIGAELGSEEGEGP